MKINARYATGGILGLLLAGVTFWACLYHSLLVGKVARYRAQLHAAGERLNLREATPLPLPPDRNNARYIREAMGLFNAQKTFMDNIQPPAMRLVAPGKAMVGWAHPEVLGDKTNSWEQVECELRMYQPVLSEIPRLIECPTMDFHLDYAVGPSLLLPHLANFRKAAQLISAAALSDLHSGDATTAATEVQGIVALSKGLRDEPLVISQLVRIAVAQIAFNNTWELLQAPGLTDPQLGALQAEWEGLDLNRPAEEALTMERAFMGHTVADMRSSSAAFRSILGMGGGGGSGNNWFEALGGATVSKVTEGLWRFSWSYTDELRALQGEQVLVESIRGAQRNASFKEALDQQKIRLQQLGFPTDGGDRESGRSPGYELQWLWSQSVTSLQRFPHRVLAAEAARELAVTAIALKRFSVRHGNYPPDLSSLVPEFLPSIPRDPVDGEPLRYRVDPPAGFWLYSIGEDGQDDHADATPASGEDPKSLGWHKGRDWVWPQPASAAEIAESFKKTSKWKSH
jgi:hypothetical protein